MSTLPTRATGFSPFKLLFSDEAMTPGELAAKSLRIRADRESADRGVSLGAWNFSRKIAYRP